MDATLIVLAGQRFWLVRIDALEFTCRNADAFSPGTGGLPMFASGIGLTVEATRMHAQIFPGTSKTQIIVYPDPFLCQQIYYRARCTELIPYYTLENRLSKLNTEVKGNAELKKAYL